MIVLRTDTGAPPRKGEDVIGETSSRKSANWPGIFGITGAYVLERERRSQRPGGGDCLTKT